MLFILFLQPETTGASWRESCYQLKRLRLVESVKIKAPSRPLDEGRSDASGSAR